MSADLYPTFNVERSGRNAVVSLHGDLDYEAEDAIVQALRSAALLDGLAAIEVDATEVTFIDSSGIRALLLGNQAALDRGLSYVVRYARPGPVARIVSITGLAEVLPAAFGCGQMRVSRRDSSTDG